MPRKAGPRGPYKRSGEAKPRTCQYCKERHYVSIVCEQKQLALNPPPPEPEPAPVVQTMPAFGRIGQFAEQANAAGHLRIAPASPFQNVIPDPSWDLAG